VDVKGVKLILWPGWQNSNDEMAIPYNLINREVGEKN
jgi:hypothetical protein